MKPQNLTSLNLFSEQVSYLPNMGNSSVIKAEPRSAQMTIFYGGEVMVFDDFPAEKAKEIMSFATKGNSQIQNNNYAYTFTQAQPSFPAPAATSTSPFPFDVNIMHESGNNLIQKHHHPQSSLRPVVCDLPLTRKASLYRFMEKRKDRINNRTPYKKNNSITAPHMPAESMSWLALSPHSPQDRSDSYESCSNFV